MTKTILAALMVAASVSHVAAEGRLSARLEKLAAATCDPQSFDRSMCQRTKLAASQALQRRILMRLNCDLVKDAAGGYACDEAQKDFDRVLELTFFGPSNVSKK